MSWEQLRSIAYQNRETEAYWAAQLPRACPFDGTPLQTGGPSGSQLFCPMGDFYHPQDWDVTTMAGM